MRKVIQLAQVGGHFAVLCEDGSVWIRVLSDRTLQTTGAIKYRYKWRKLGIPGTGGKSLFADSAPCAGVGRIEAVKRLRDEFGCTLKHALEAAQCNLSATTFGQARQYLRDKRHMR